MKALAELRGKLPWGGPGRTVNSFIFPRHPDALVGAIRAGILPATLTRLLIYREAYESVCRCVRETGAYFRKDFPVCIALVSGRSPGALSFTARELTRSGERASSRIAAGYVHLPTMQARWVYSAVPESETCEVQEPTGE